MVSRTSSVNISIVRVSVRGGADINIKYKWTRRRQQTHTRTHTARCKFVIRIDTDKSAARATESSQVEARHTTRINRRMLSVQQQQLAAALCQCAQGVAGGIEQGGRQSITSRNRNITRFPSPPFYSLRNTFAATETFNINVRYARNANHKRTVTQTHTHTHTHNHKLAGTKTFVNVAKYHLKEICSLAAARCVTHT